MDYRHLRFENTTITRDLKKFEEKNKNQYETIAIIAKRANQLSAEMKEELTAKLQEFTVSNDNMDEVFENREQIEVSKFYEKLPKSTLIAINEFINDKIYFRNPKKTDINQF
ncbi:MAG: DNA-directed RNA polymerase subunit omega [Bacteroidota bacterium]|nr:DNA-directed RNA polymerase subunit omega [Bacteroidota bacterium]